MQSTREETLAAMVDQRLGAIIRTKDQALAADAMWAAVRGGFRMVEFTMTTPGALELIHTFAQDARLMVGAGTVMTTAQVEQARDAGARFMVSPHFDPEVVAATVERGLVSVPGTATPSEMVAARRAGADFVKLFPAPADIATYVRQLVGPLPDIRVFPTAGVSPDNFEAILRAGAAGVGFVSSLFAPQDMGRRDFDAIERRAAGIFERWSRLRESLDAQS
jgi:Entner-Doudoroff aldolase